MKTSIRWWSRLAFVASVGLSALAACSSDRPDGGADEQGLGTLALALQATAPSGNVYMLRSAFFQITNARTGETVQFLNSDEMPEASELTTLLTSGDYTVTLLPGWFLERVGTGAPGGFGGTTGPSPGFGGTFSTAGKASTGFGGAFEKPSPGSNGKGGAGSDPVFGEGGLGPIFNEAGSGPIFGEGGSGPISGEGGSGPIGGGEVVNAQLLSNAVQFISIFAQQDSFVHYQFRVGDEIVDFTKGRLHITIGVEEDPTVCVVPEGVLRPERMLLETNVDAVSNVDVFGVFKALTSNGGHTGDPIALYQQIFDSFASAGLATVPDAVHCGDEMTDGVPTLNGFPIDCDRNERFQVDNMGAFFPTAFVNRMDLAPANGAHCGQQRMIFANRSFNRAFMILEAQIPNPAPELGIQGCQPLAQFWLDQNTIDDPFTRGQRLAQAFLFGHPDLEAFGFGPFYTAENLTVGSGQIRTNTFDSGPWTLREFKLALDGEQLRALPFPVAESPHGQLWNENAPLPQGEACRENFPSALDGLLTDNMAQMSFVVDGACKDSESRNDFGQDYSIHLSDGFRGQLDEKLAGSGLDATDIANRAHFAGSCMGCHQEASGKFLGRDVFAPFSGDFPQVTESAQECSGGEAGLCFPPSAALRSTFLPSRMQVLSSLLGVPNIPNPCSGGGGGGSGGSSGFGGSFGTAGTSSTAGAFSTGGFGTGPGEPGSSGEGPMGGPVPIPVDPDPAPVVEIELPSADESVEVLEEVDAEIREAYGDVTLSGRSAKVTH